MQSKLANKNAGKSQQVVSKCDLPQREYAPIDFGSNQRKLSLSRRTWTRVSRHNTRSDKDIE